MRPGKTSFMVYELHVGSFNCLGDSTLRLRGGDGGSTTFRTLGINVIELMPANSNGSPRGWGL